jgi:hypothetical protein
LRQSVQVRHSIPAAPGRLERYDMTATTSATAPTCLSSAPRTAWRKVKVTRRRAAHDFAHCIRDLVDIHCPEAQRIRVVLD